MERVIQQFRLTIATTKPWVLVAIVVAAGLFLYFAAQGIRYWQVAGSNSSAKEDIGRLERATGQLPEDAARQEGLLEVKMLRLENLHRLFDYPATDTLMSIVSDTAEGADLDLVSMTAEAITVEPRGTLQYQVRPISVIMDGPTAKVQDFLSTLFDQVPVVVASNTRIVNLDTNPSIQLRLRFYLSPEPIPDDGETETDG